MPKPLVSISCITYNHAKYIRDALKGFLIQKTTFPIEILIHDDASTDGTTEIIKEYEKKYPDIIKPMYETENQWNKGKKGSAVFNFPRAEGKYIALCEGDDYWTDPYKLQKQVDFLEANEESGMVYTKVRYFYHSKNKYARKSWGGPATTFDQLIIGNQIPTPTAVFRKDLIHRFMENIHPELHAWEMRDYPMWVYFALKSKIHFMNEETAVYRVLDESISHSQDLKKRESFIRSCYAMKQFMLEYANVKYAKRELEDRMLSSLAINALLMKNQRLAKSYIAQIKKLTLKMKIKRIVYGCRILSFVYSLSREFWCII
jgi:glycosyltransferase involved in cell wall biosynthesis